MKENNKHIILVLGLAALTAVAAAVLTCVLLMPKLMLGRRLDEILKDTYTYNAEASVAGVDMGILGDEFEGSITGSRSNDVIYGSISYKGFECLEIYVENDGKVMLNIEKLFESAVNKAEEKTGLPLDFIRNKLTDFTISSSQIEDITGEKLVTMADAGVTHNTLEEFVQAVKLLSSFKQIKAEDMAAEYKLLGDDAGRLVQVHQTPLRRRASHPADVSGPPPLPEKGHLRDQDRSPFLDHLAAVGGHYAGNAENKII